MQQCVSLMYSCSCCSTACYYPSFGGARRLLHAAEMPPLAGLHCLHLKMLLAGIVIAKDTVFKVDSCSTNKLRRPFDACGLR